LQGAALANQDRFEEVVRPLENRQHLAPTLLRAQRVLARVYRRLGQPVRAAVCASQSFTAFHDLRREQAASQAATR
jgi:hypothetical protein